MLGKEIGRNYVRYRIRNPARFKAKSFRILDIGRSGFHKLIRARLKSNNKFLTQSVLVERKYEKQEREETKEIIRRAKQEN